MGYFGNKVLKRSKVQAYKVDEDKYGLVKNKINSSIQKEALDGKLSKEQVYTIIRFMEDYITSGKQANFSAESIEKTMFSFLKHVRKAMEDPHQFKPFHQAIRQPLDYYQWGNDFMRPLVIMEKSRALGVDQLTEMEEKIKHGENVVILSNHQTEADPQVVSILLEEHGFESLAEKIIFVAGHKVTNDPMAIPFSMGRNLLCIHSKKHIKNPPELIEKKQAQNLESMKAMGELAAAGGNIFWVAPSGGRDRPNPETGKFEVAPFDSKALDMFKLIAFQSGKPMHFFPMAMYTHNLIPPPSSVSSGLGEERSAKRGAVSIHILPATEGLGGLKDLEFKTAVEAKVCEAYHALSVWHDSQQ